MRPRKPISTGRRVQLHRALSKLGWGSRTQAWAWIRAGQVEVDGSPVTDPLTWVDLDRQRITRAGQEPAAPPRLALALHKPRGIVTTRKDERGRRTVYDLLPPDLPWIFPVGRLDAESEGLLVLTNDSALAVCLTGPQYHLRKTYHVTFAGHPDGPVIEQLRNGVPLSDGVTRPAQVRVLNQLPDATLVEMVLTEGRNRQIRRMGATLGQRVLRLVRVAIGAFPLGNLSPGEWHVLSDTDIALLRTP